VRNKVTDTKSKWWKNLEK